MAEELQQETGRDDASDARPDGRFLRALGLFAAVFLAALLLGVTLSALRN